MLKTKPNGSISIFSIDFERAMDFIGGAGAINLFVDERKTWMEVAGNGLFVILSVYALWVLNSGIIVVPKVDAGQPAPPEARALVFFLALSVCGLVAAAGLLLTFLKPSIAKIPKLILVPVGLMLFFMVYHLQRF